MTREERIAIVLTRRRDEAGATLRAAMAAAAATRARMAAGQRRLAEEVAGHSGAAVEAAWRIATRQALVALAHQCDADDTAVTAARIAMLDHHRRARAFATLSAGRTDARVRAADRRLAQLSDDRACVAARPAL